MSAQFLEKSSFLWPAGRAVDVETSVCSLLAMSVFPAAWSAVAWGSSGKPRRARPVGCAQTRAMLFCTALLVSGCVSAPNPAPPANPAPAPANAPAENQHPHAHPAPAAKPVKPPFAYEPLQVRNSCFVESVHFYDEYLRKRRGETTWARVLQWGNSDGDIDVNSGHAVTVFVAKDQLWFYDVNFGVVPLDLPVHRRGDITDVTPRVFSRYPQFRPLFARYRDDLQQKPAKPRAQHLFYHANPDVRDATRVAHALGAHRPVAVFEFDLVENGQLVTAAGASFRFGQRVCLYIPRGGTHISPAFRGSYDDLRYIEQVVKRLFRTTKTVRWQPGGYVLFPPKP